MSARCLLSRVVVGAFVIGASLAVSAQAAEAAPAAPAAQAAPAAPAAQAAVTEGQIEGVVLSRNQNATAVRVIVDKVIAGDSAPQGKTCVFYARWATVEGKSAPLPAQVALIRSTAVATRVKIDYESEDRLWIKSLVATSLEYSDGAIEGLVLSRTDRSMEVRVEKVLSGYAGFAGRNLAFAALWVKGPKGVWIPKPEQSALFQSAPLGARVHIEYYANEHFRVKSLEVTEKPTEGTVSADIRGYSTERNAPLGEKGAVIGGLVNAPAADITLLDGAGATAASRHLEEGAREYQLDPVSPGTYTLRVSADGFRTLELPDLEVKAGARLRVRLEFHPLATEHVEGAAAPKQ